MSFNMNNIIKLCNFKFQTKFVALNVVKAKNVKKLINKKCSSGKSPRNESLLDLLTFVLGS